MVRAYDIILLPSSGLAERAIQMSELLRHYDTRFTLDLNGPLPHLSLYMAQLADTNLDVVASQLSQIAEQTTSFMLDAIDYSQERGYFDVAYKRTEPLAELQMKVIAAVKPLRYGPRPGDDHRLSTALGLERVNIERYGYSAVGEAFRPHLTFTRFVSEDTVMLTGLPEPASFSGLFTALGLCEMGERNGVSVRIVASFKLAR